MLEARRDEDLAHEPPVRGGARREQLLERHRPVEQLIEGLHHSPDPAATDLAGDSISRGLGELVRVRWQRDVRVIRGLRVEEGRGSERLVARGREGPGELTTRDAALEVCVELGGFVRGQLGRARDQPIEAPAGFIGHHDTRISSARWRICA
jgi:hypothetical protein